MESIALLPEIEDRDNKSLKNLWDQIVDLKKKYDTISLARDIKALQDSSRIQNLPPEMRMTLLKELQKRKLLKQILDGESIN